MNAGHCTLKKKKKKLGYFIWYYFEVISQKGKDSQQL